MVVAAVMQSDVDELLVLVSLTSVLMIHAAAGGAGAVVVVVSVLAAEVDAFGIAAAADAVAVVSFVLGHLLIASLVSVSPTDHNNNNY